MGIYRSFAAVTLATAHGGVDHALVARLAVPLHLDADRIEAEAQAEPMPESAIARHSSAFS
jgi:hypothetical protein